MTGHPPNQCRRCNTDLTNSSPTGRWSRSCPKCNYITCAWRPDVEIALSDVTGTLAMSPSLPHTAGHDETLEALRRIEALIIEELCGFVGRNPRGVNAWLFDLLEKSQAISESYAQSPSRMQSVPYRAIQIIYAMLLLEGHEFQLSPTATSEELRACSNLYESVTNLIGTTNMITLGRRGQRDLRIRHGRLISSPTEIDHDLFELAQNIAEMPVSEDIGLPVIDAWLAEAERVIFGISITDLFSLVQSFAQIDKSGVISIDLDRLPASKRTLIDFFTLSVNRLWEFEAPYFFDLGLPATSSNKARVLKSCTEMLWLPYYPFLTACGMGQQSPGIAVSTKEAFAVAQSAGEMTKAYRLVRLMEYAKDNQDDEGRIVLQSISALVHQKFEVFLADMALSMGLRVEASVAVYRDKQLPCGEIDVLAHGRGVDGATIIIVIEAKNVDVPLMKDFSYENLSRTLSRAVVQTVRKRKWAASELDKVADILQIENIVHPIILGIIATRRPVPLAMLDGLAGGSPSEVEELMKEALTVPHSHWRADLAASVIRNDEFHGMDQ